MYEYKTVYTVDGEGYTKEKPWLDYYGDDLHDAQQAQRELESTRNFGKVDVWIERREVSEWQRYVK